MASQVYFNGKLRKLPGAYSKITSGEQNTPAKLDFGKVMVIDTGLGATYGGGSGINSLVSTPVHNGKDAVYQFQDVDSYKAFLKGGLLWKLAEKLFFPYPGVSGVSTVYHVKAAVTDPAKMTFIATGGGAAGGTFKVICKDEGAVGNATPAETRAQSTATITNAGSTADKITIKVSGVTVAEYTNLSSDNIATVVAGLAANMTSRGICAVVSSTSPNLVFKAPVGLGATTITPTVVVTGTATGSCVAFAGGVNNTALYAGYGFTIETGKVDPTKFIYKIWLGQWKGDWTDGLAFNEVAKADTTPILVVASPEFNNIQTLIDWATKDQSFGNHFILDPTSAVTGTGVVTTADISALVGAYQLATGGLETYSSSALSDVFEAIKDLDFQYILCDKYGSGNFDSTEAGMIFAHINDAGTDFNKTLVYGAGKDEVEFSAADGSLDAAAYYNSNKAIVVHGGVKETTQLLAGGYRIWPAIYHAATVLGRICGLQPQIPITNKLIGVDGLVHNIKVKDQEVALDKGVLVTVQDNARGGFKVLQGVNTLQDNKFLFNSLGKSYSIQFERIVNQINRELVVNSQTDLLNNENGVNVNTLSPGILRTWVETYLQSRVATPDSDNLLLSFRNVTVTRVEDYYNVTYGIVVNNEVTKIFYTGFLFKS